MIQQLFEASGIPAIQACVRRGGEVVLEACRGATRETIFDIASVTKVIATASAALVLVDRGVVCLEDPVRRFLPEAADGITLRHLLAHTSGLPAWKPLFLEGDVLAAALRTRPERPPGTCLYSDIGYILLGEALARAAGQPLDRLCDERVFAPLQLDHTGYRRKGSDWAPTGRTRPRPPAAGQSYEVPAQEPREAPGEVDDDNAWAMGGVAGHAGVFSTAADVALWGERILEDLAGAGRLCGPTTLQTFLALDRHEGPPRSLGFDRPSGERSSAGTRIGRAGPLGAVGHLGFTGCSIWIDLDRKLSVALVSNRVYPSRGNEEGIRALRPAFHDAVVAALEES